MKTRRTALSPIELLVVIVIIIFVPSILMASLEAARELAKIPICANQLRQIGLAIPLYAEAYDNSMPWWGFSGAATATPFDPYAGSEESHPYVAYREDWIWPSAELQAMRMACLYEGKFITEPRIFYCPANEVPMFKYESYINPPPWGYLPQYFNTGPPPRNQWVRVGYTYFPTDPNDPKDPWGVPSQTARRFDGLDPNIPYMTDIMRHNTQYPKEKLSHNIHDNPGVNALFKDGHVVYCDDRDVFDDLVWDEAGPGMPWREFYYRVFKLIGQSCGPTE